MDVVLAKHNKFYFCVWLFLFDGHAKRMYKVREINIGGKTWERLQQEES